MTRRDEDGDLAGTIPADDLGDVRTPDTLADALWASSPEERMDESHYVFRAELRTLAADVYQLGQKDALIKAANSPDIAGTEGGRYFADALVRFAAQIDTDGEPK